jgi:hypothetical protein
LADDDPPVLAPPVLEPPLADDDPPVLAPPVLEPPLLLEPELPPELLLLLEPVLPPWSTPPLPLAGAHPTMSPTDKAGMRSR